MPVSGFKRVLERESDLKPSQQHHYQQFLRASQFPVQSEGSGNGEENASGDESETENDLDSCNLPLNLVSTQLGES